MGVGCAHGAGLGVSTSFNGIKIKIVKVPNASCRCAALHAACPPRNLKIS